MENKELKKIDMKKSKISTVLVILLILFIVFLKQSLVSDLPINILAHAKQDDALMVDMAK